jgi:large subunit ribosomal protein L18
MSNLNRKKIEDKRSRHRRARMRIRQRVRGTEERPRLCVHKSLRYVYAQVVNDLTGQTLVQASSLESDIRGNVEGGAKTKAAARLVGTRLAERAKAKGIEQVVFDRGGYVYHGRVKELAEGAREAGLDF